MSTRLVFSRLFNGYSQAVRDLRAHNLRCEMEAGGTFVASLATVVVPLSIASLDPVHAPELLFLLGAASQWLVWRHVRRDEALPALLRDFRTRYSLNRGIMGKIEDLNHKTQTALHVLVEMSRQSPDMSDEEARDIVIKAVLTD